MDNREAFVKKILKQEYIAVDNTLMRGLGYEDTRSFFEAMGNWGYNTDFNTIPAACDTKVQSYLRAFIKSFLD